MSVDEESYRNAGVAAAHRGQSVSGLIRDFFRSLKPEEPGHRTLSDALFEVMDREGIEARVEGRERDRSKLYDR